MIRTFTISLLVCVLVSTQNASAQNDSNLEKEIAEAQKEMNNFFRDRIASLDPIEGEYDCESYGTYVTPFVRQNLPVERAKMHIKRKAGSSNTFLVFLWPSNDPRGMYLSIERIGETNAYSMSYFTSSCRIYLQNNNHFSATIRLDHKSAIEYTENRMLGRGIDVALTYDCIKTYPTSTMYADAIKKEIEEAQPTEWTGTGFALTNNYIVTNNHVVEGARSIYIQGVNGNFNNKYSATVVATDKYNDLALLKVNGCSISSVPYSVKTSTADVGEDIFVLGYPLTSTMGDEIKLTTGVVSSKTGFQGNVSMYQISAPIQPGNSGGPLFDSKGNVIGIVSAKHQGAENVGYAVKTSYLRSLIESTTSADILPHNNKISALGVTGKVKAVKNFVYYITCSSSAAGNNDITKSPSGNGESNHGGNTHSDKTSYISGKTYNNPSIRTNCSNNTKILSVTLEGNRTIVKMSDNNRTRNGGYYTWMTIDPNTYIKVNGKKYSLIRAEDIAISPNRTSFSYEGETKTFTLYFPAIPKTTTSMDLIESVSSEWQFYGIQLKSNSGSRKQNAEYLFE